MLAEAGAGGDQTTYTFYDDLHRPTIALLDFDGDANDCISYEPNAVFVNDATTFTCDANDFVTRTEYDLSGNVVKVTDREGNATDTTYDGANRVIKVEQAPVAGGRPTMLTTYDDNSNLVLVTDPEGNQTRTYYDTRNRLTKSILDLNGDGRFDPNRPGTDIVTDTHYDLMDNVIQTKDPRGNVTDAAYDRAYRPVTVTGPAVADAENGGLMTRPVTTAEYDRNSNVTKVTDPRGVQTVNVYDGLNRWISVTKAFGTADAVTTTTGYDENDNVVELTLDNGPAGLQTTTFTFDPFDRQIMETWPGGNLTTTTYYRNGLVQVVIDPKGQKTEAYYDRAERVVTTRHRRTDNSIEETRRFTYDRMDNILTALDLSGLTSYTYDALYRVLTESRTDTGQYPYTVISTYDLNGNRTSCTYPQTGRVLTSTYDRLNRLVQVVDSVGLNTTTYGYDENSNITSRMLPNGVIDTFTYDALNRVLTHVSTAGGPNIYWVEYTYDLADNRRTITETVQGQPTRNLVYNYDDQYRLTSESWAGNNYTYTYDLAGNRLTKTFNGVTTAYTYNARNELLTEVTGSVTATYTYDENGNRTQKAVGGGGPITDYIWDVHNRLVEAIVDSTTVFEAQYDYRTRRLTKTEGGTATYFRYDGGVSFHEVTGGLTPTIQVEFIRGSGLGGGIGSILYSDRSATGGPVEFFCYNAVGHTVALTNASAAVVKTNLYEAFGNIVSSTGTSLNNRLANTKERDFSIGLDNHGFRYYDPSAGRYISPDPAGYIDGMNVYLYVLNNPCSYVDPSGKSIWTKGIRAIRKLYKKIKIIRKIKRARKKLDKVVKNIKKIEKRITKIEEQINAVKKKVNNLPGKKQVDQIKKLEHEKKRIEQQLQELRNKEAKYGKKISSYEKLKLSLASFIAQRAIKESQNPHASKWSVVCAGGWDIAESIDPIFVTDFLNWLFGLDEDHEEIVHETRVDPAIENAAAIREEVERLRERGHLRQAEWLEKTGGQFPEEDQWRPAFE